MSLIDELNGVTEKYQEYTETQMPFSVIVPWRSGDLHREQSFKKMMECLAVQQTPASKEKITMEVIVVEHSFMDKSSEARTKIGHLVPKKIVAMMYPFSNFRYVHLISPSGHPDDFNKSWCMNVGARLAIYDHLIFIDADSLFGHDYIRTLKYEIKRTQHPKNQVMHLWNYLIKMDGKDEPIVRWVRPDVTRAMGGIWYVNKHFYWNVFGGMNENYAGYGGEDNDAFERAVWAFQQLGSPDSYPNMVPYTLVHQYHDNERQASTVPLWLKTRTNPREVISRLKTAKLGNQVIPTKINMDDLNG